MWARHQLDQWSKDSDQAKRNDKDGVKEDASTTSPSSPKRSLSPKAQLWLTQKTQTLQTLSQFAENVKKTFSQEK